MRVIGIDIGGTGIKGAPVDVVTGRVLRERVRVLTPRPSAPDAVVEAVREVIARSEPPAGPAEAVGIAFPGVITRGVTRTAANVDARWIDLDADALFTEALGVPVHLVNDADAAGAAEMRFGAGRGRTGTVLVLTFGTGIGSALFTRGVLVPCTELGHLELHGHVAEHHAAGNVRESLGLSWEKWAHRVQTYLRHVDMLFTPELIVIGGGVSRKADRFLPLVRGVRAEVVPAELHNDAGVVGAALAVTGPAEDT